MCVNNPSVHSLVFGSRVPYKASLEMAWNQTYQWRYIINTERKPSESYSPSFLQVQVRTFQHLDHKLVTFSNSFLNCEEKFHLTHNLIRRTKCPAFTQAQTIGHFRVPKNLTFKARLSAKPLIWKWFLIMMQIKLIFTTKVSHLASFWEWDFLELGNGLFTTLTAYMQSFIHENDNEAFSTQNIINILLV